MDSTATVGPDMKKTITERNVYLLVQHILLKLHGWTSGKLRRYVSGRVSWHPRDATLPPTAYLGMYETGRRSGFYSSITYALLPCRTGTISSRLCASPLLTGWL
jgi:hypothetical protein